MKVKVVLGVSNRHVHLKEETYNILFDEPIKIVKELKQPGQFASDKFVTIKNSDRKIERVRVLGPFRDYNQVEISKTDSYFLKVNPPIRDSGDLDGSESITLVTDKAEVTLKEGCIIATRHIHITPEDMKKYGFKENEKIQIKVEGEKGGILNNVRFKVAKESSFELHLDTDDANAFGLKTEDLLEIIEMSK